MRTAMMTEGTQLIESLQSLRSYNMKGVHPPPLEKRVSTRQFRVQGEYRIIDNPLLPPLLHPPESLIRNTRTGSYLLLRRKNG